MNTLFIPFDFKTTVTVLLIAISLSCSAQNDAAKISEAKYALETAKDCNAAEKALSEVSNEGRVNQLYVYYMAKTEDCLNNYSLAILFYKKYLTFFPDDAEVNSSINQIIAELTYKERKKQEAREEERQRERRDSIYRVEKAEREQTDKAEKREYENKKAADAEKEREAESKERRERQKQAYAESKNVSLYSGYNWSGIGIGYTSFTHKDKSPSVGAINLNYMLGLLTLQDKGYLDFNFNFDIGTGSNSNYIANAFGKNPLSFSSFGKGGSDLNIMIGLSRLVVTQPKFCLALGGEIGFGTINMPKVELTYNPNFIDYYFEDLGFSFNYGLKTYCFIGHNIAFKLEYLKNSKGSITTSQSGLNNKTVDLKYDQFKFGVDLFISK